jgi:hypothetical protein
MQGGNSAVTIAIFDTKKVVSGHPIFPCANLKDFVNTYLHDRVLIPGDCVDEFLAYDSVQVDVSYASFKSLMAAELFGFIPELSTPACYRALTVHLLSLRGRFIDTDALLKRAITAFFRLVQLQSFVRIDHACDVGPGSLVVYKYTPTGHGVTSSTALELKPYSALVDTMCEVLMIRHDEKLCKTTGGGIVDTICCMYAPPCYRSS